MCCGRASGVESQSQAQQVVGINLPFLSRGGCLTSQGGTRADLRATVLLDAGPIYCVTLAAWRTLGFVTESCMFSRDTDSLVSPGTLPGHTGSQGV